MQTRCTSCTFIMQVLPVVQDACCAGAGLLAGNYVGTVAAALRMPGAFRARLMVPAHLLLLAALLAQTARLDRERHTATAIATFYRGIWNLFYAGARQPLSPVCWSVHLVVTNACVEAMWACMRRALHCQ